MTISVLSAAKRLGAVSGWILTNLEMQKLCYFAHMYFMGYHEGRPLVWGEFEAWDYGPVHPDLYRELKEYGSDQIPQSVFLGHDDIEESHPGIEYLDSAFHQLPRERLVSLSHRKGGAWRKKYKPYVRHIRISNKDILEEFEFLQNGIQRNQS